MRNRGQNGAITVFLSIILLIMIVLTGAIVDGARINAAEFQIQRAAEISVRSALAGYNTPLKERYGLFALSDNNKENLEEIILDYLSKNLMVDKEYLDKKKVGQYMDLYDYEIENIEIELMFNLTENPVTRWQILEYMKYRAPKEFADEFLDKLQMFKKAGATSEAYKKKIDFEKELKKIEKIQREIYKNIYGEYEEYKLWMYKKKTLKYFVRKLNTEEYSRLIDKYMKDISNYKKLEKELAEIKQKIKGEKSEDELKELQQEKEKIRNEIDRVDDDIKVNYNRLIDEINQYDNANKKAGEKINKLIEESKNIQEKLNSFKRYIHQEKSQNNIMEESLKQLSGEVQEYESLISTDEGKNNLNEIKSELNKNRKCLNGESPGHKGVINLITKINPQKAQELTKESLENLKRDIIDEIKIYNNQIEYNYILEEKEAEYREYDTREANQNQANEKITIKGAKENEKEIIISDKEYSILPSILKSGHRETGIEFLWKTQDGTQSYDKAECIEFHKQEKAGFSEAAFSFLGERTKEINTTNIRDEIYINEYIMGIFKNYVSDRDEEYNLRHLRKSEQETFFNKSEIEYILNGSKSEAINQAFMDSKILITRFCFNSIHVFGCEDKKILATSIATSVAGWYTGGAGIPIIRTLILLGWAMGESVWDLEELKKGNEVPLYKSEKDWNTGIKVPKKSQGYDKNTSSTEANPMNTSYQDYLRFFLLVQDKNKTMKRVQDLIQLNMQKITGDRNFRLDGFHTYIKMEAVVSIKYLFLTQSFIPKEFKTQNDRHKFKVVIYQGY